MKTLVVIVAWVNVTGMMTMGVATQVERPFVFNRICNIEPGQETAAVTLAQEMVNFASSKYPGAHMAARKGRWMTGFQEISQPVDQILFSEQHPTLSDYHDFTDILLADDAFQALQQKTRGVIDASSCVETRFRASP